VTRQPIIISSPRTTLKRFVFIANTSRSHPANALAHYHLGFAYGMTGDETREINEYERATALGLSRWDLFLNLGIAFLAGC
jgi:hypothetical protein